MRPGCYSSAQLSEADRAFGDLIQAIPQGSDIVMGGGIDPVAGMIVIETQASSPGHEMAERFKAERGSIVQVVNVDVRRAGRMNDGSAHYGGARINADGAPYNCTAGFAMDKNGGRWMVTAAHCNSVYPWWPPYNGLLVDYRNGAGGFYGTVMYRGTAHQDQYGGFTDAELIGDGTHQYSRIIHVDPCSPCTRVVTAKSNPSLNTYVCHSGATSKAKCGYKVTHVHWWLADGMNSSGYRAVRADGSWPIQEADSGGPVYTQIGSSSARIRGLVFAIGGGVVFEPVSDVEAALGATVAVTCCNNDSW